jgi:hypothetical protein
MITQEALPEWQERRRDAGFFPAESFFISRQSFFPDTEHCAHLRGRTRNFHRQRFCQSRQCLRRNRQRTLQGRRYPARILRVPPRSDGLPGARKRHEWRTYPPAGQ